MNDADLKEVVFTRLEVETLGGWDELWGDNATSSVFIDSSGSQCMSFPVRFDQVEEVLYLRMRISDIGNHYETLVRLEGEEFAYLIAWGTISHSRAVHSRAFNINALFKYAMTTDRAQMIKSAL